MNNKEYPYFKRIFGKVLILLLFLVNYSCNVQIKVGKEKQEHKSEKKVLETYIGWWVYGEGQHIFKDEKTLEEYNLEFPNENIQELVDLYLAVCEMEYFPMECSMTGYNQNYSSSKQNILVVTEFEILYIQGCGE